MSDRTWVALDVTTPRLNPLTGIEDAAFKMLVSGVMVQKLSDIDFALTVDDESTYGHDGILYHYGESEVPVGNMAQAAASIVDLMRANVLPKRSFAAEEDGYGGALGWRVEYDCVTDRLIDGLACDGDFQIGLNDLIRWYNEHGRDGDAMMRTVLHTYDVRLPAPPSPVVDLINRINAKHAHLTHI